MSTYLKEVINQRILTDIIKVCRTNSDYKVLVLDSLATKIISSCCKMVDIMSENIMIIEDLHKKRQPLPKKEAIYFLTPTDKSIRDLLGDFQCSSPDKVQYKGCHLFFTDRVPHELFQEIATSPVAKFIKNFREINIAFIATENRIFELDMPDTLVTMYNPDNANNKFGGNSLDRIADQLSTICATLGEYPSIRFFRNSSQWSAAYQTDHCERLASLVLQKLNSFKADDPEIGEAGEKHKSQLIILDRSFDVISPLMHELTYQAMVMDLVVSAGKSSTDVYTYTKPQPNGDVKTVQAPLDEDDELWVKHRHSHIAVVSNAIPEAIKNFSEKKKINNLSGGNGKSVTIKQLTDTVRKMPQFQKELSAYECHQNLAEQSMSAYNNGVEDLCKIEQDLAMGENQAYQKIKEPMREIIPSLLNKSLKSTDKVRIILLYILFKGGISSENLHKLCDRAEIDEHSKQIIMNYSKLGLPLFDGPESTSTAETENGIRGVAGGAFHRKNREHQIRYSISRWTPAIKDVIEQAIEGKLDTKMFPYLNDRRETLGGGSRAGKYSWNKAGKSQTGSKVIVFMLGGMTASEMRSVYEVSDMFLPKDANGNPIDLRLNAEDNAGQKSSANVRPAMSARAGRNTRDSNKSSLSGCYNVPWECLLGSTHKFSPGGFLAELGKL